MAVIANFAKYLEFKTKKNAWFSAMPPPSIELVKEIKGHVLNESVRECQKRG